MSREVRRVPMDFDWPMHKVWKGYINPYYKKCPDCTRGYTQAYEMLESVTNLIMVCGSDAASKRKRTHPWVLDIGCHTFSTPAGPDMVALTTGLAGRAPDGPIGHDASDRWNATRKIIKAAGLDPETWGRCPTCKGESIDPSVQEKYDTWKDYEPPTGDGYQLWETVSEGSPISPVFKSLDELCEWAEKNASWFGDMKATKEQWKDALEAGCAGMMVLVTPRE